MPLRAVAERNQSRQPQAMPSLKPLQKASIFAAPGKRIDASAIGVARFGKVDASGFTGLVVNSAYVVHCAQSISGFDTTCVVDDQRDASGHNSFKCRVHCLWHPVRADDGGLRPGRLPDGSVQQHPVRGCRSSAGQAM